jgi:AraC family transcriptional regulator
VDSSGNEPLGACAYGAAKYGMEGLLASSAALGWSALSAELRRHDRGQFTWNTNRPEAEVCVAISSSDSLVTRSTGGVVDRAIAQRGTAWLSPTGPKEGRVALSAPVPQLLHLYLPTRHFSAESLGVDINHRTLTSLRYEYSFHDPLVAEIAFAIVAELRTQTAGGRLLAETLAISLAARLIHNRAGASVNRLLLPRSKQGLDRRRLTRVVDYIGANLEGDLTISQLAKVASLSRFHFARAFKAAVGKSPHQYVSAQRLLRAKELLIRGDESLLDIAVALNFSSQANFTRAFHNGTGMTPGQYRRSFMHRMSASAQ